MGTLARRAIKTLVLFCLFFFSVRYVHTYPLPMPPHHQYYLRRICELFAVDDYEFFYICSMVAIDLIVTMIAYSLLMKLWRRYRAKR